MPAKLCDRRLRVVITVACEFCDADLLVLQDTPEIRCRYCGNFTPVASACDDVPAA
jgi:primosomal protein N'